LVIWWQCLCCKISLVWKGKFKKLSVNPYKLLISIAKLELEEPSRWRPCCSVTSCPAPRGALGGWLGFVGLCGGRDCFQGAASCWCHGTAPASALPLLPEPPAPPSTVRKPKSGAAPAGCSPAGLGGDGPPGRAEACPRPGAGEHGPCSPWPPASLPARGWARLTTGIYSGPSLQPPPARVVVAGVSRLRCGDADPFAGCPCFTPCRGMKPLGRACKEKRSLFPSPRFWAPNFSPVCLCPDVRKRHNLARSLFSRSFPFTKQM